jgi:hypothetical protein
VRIAVDFDDEAGLKADEVDDIAAYWVLASELPAIHPMGTEALPQDLFSVGHVPTELFCVRLVVRVASHAWIVRGDLLLANGLNRGVLQRTPLSPALSPCGEREEATLRVRL